ncbi:MAG: RNA polymerase factor sigma-54 [Bacteroidales bacterium]|nr:RNA polymerase factor sigma-54 [Bacteroidales bacterium]
MLKQTQHLRLLQRLSPQQIQLMKLIQLPIAELEQRIKEELISNPALDTLDDTDDDENIMIIDDEIDKNNELDYPDIDDEKTDIINDDDELLDEYIDEDEIPEYKLYINNTSPDDSTNIQYYDYTTKTLNDYLKEQLDYKNLSEQEYLIGEYIIGNIDDNGYLQRSIDAIVNDLLFIREINTNADEVEKVLDIIQRFDPPGIGARDLKECLLLQLEAKEHKTPEINLAIEILENYYDDFIKKHYDQIIKKANITEDQLKMAISEIQKLNPKPGNSLYQIGNSAISIIPDFIIYNNDGELELTLNNYNIPYLCTNKKYENMYQSLSKEASNDPKKKETVQFIKQKLDGARWFINALEQRQNTLYITMKTIMELQKDFFMTGDETKLKPMILKDIADKINMDISTVSRVANSKYVATPYGTFLLKHFFSDSLETKSGKEVSNKTIKAIIKDIIKNEDKSNPLTDEELTKILEEKGFKIARRTVAKYRDQLNIPVARLRKEL